MSDPLTITSSSSTTEEEDEDSSSSICVGETSSPKFDEEADLSLDDIFDKLMKAAEQESFKQLNSYTAFDENNVDLSQSALSTIEISNNPNHANNLHARAEMNKNTAKYEILSLLIGSALSQDPNCPPFQVSLIEKISKNTGGNISWD